MEKSVATVNEIASADAVSSSPASMGGLESTVAPQKIIQSADIAVNAENPNESINKLSLETKRLGGMIISSSSMNTKTDHYNNLSFKVPADKFFDIIRFIESNCGEVISKTINTQDVTGEFIDNEARIKTKKELEIRYLALLHQAKNVTEIMEVEARLNDVRQQIESMEGQQKYLSQNTSMSQINVNFVEDEEGMSFFNRLFESFKNSLKLIQNLFFVIIPIIPILIIVAFLLLGIRKFLRKKSVSPKETIDEISHPEEIKTKKRTTK